MITIVRLKHISDIKIIVISKGLEVFSVSSLKASVIFNPKPKIIIT